jgi:hypothetical protein
MVGRPSLRMRWYSFESTFPSHKIRSPSSRIAPRPWYFDWYFFYRRRPVWGKCLMSSPDLCVSVFNSFWIAPRLILSLLAISLPFTPLWLSWTISRRFCMPMITKALQTYLYRSILLHKWVSKTLDACDIAAANQILRMLNGYLLIHGEATE